MTENTKQAIPAAWGSVLAQMSEEYAAKEAFTQMQNIREMGLLVQARMASNDRLKIEHARRELAARGAEQARVLRCAYRFDTMERVLEATQVYLEMLAAAEKSDLSKDEIARLVDRLTEECLFAIDNPDVWTLE